MWHCRELAGVRGAGGDRGERRRRGKPLRVDGRDGAREEVRGQHQDHPQVPACVRACMGVRLGLGLDWCGVGAGVGAGVGWDEVCVYRLLSMIFCILGHAELLLVRGSLTSLPTQSVSRWNESSPDFRHCYALCPPITSSVSSRRTWSLSCLLVPHASYRKPPYIMPHTYLPHASCLLGKRGAVEHPTIF